MLVPSPPFFSKKKARLWKEKTAINKLRLSFLAWRIVSIPELALTDVHFHVWFYLVRGLSDVNKVHEADEDNTK